MGRQWGFCPYNSKLCSRDVPFSREAGVMTTCAGLQVQKYINFAKSVLSFGLAQGKNGRLKAEEDTN